MSQEIPMDEVEKIVYNHPTEGPQELNALDIAGCRWRKWYNLTIPVVGHSYLNRVRSLAIILENTQANAHVADTGSENPIWYTTGEYIGQDMPDDAAITLNYGDDLAIEGTGATGFYPPEIILYNTAGTTRLDWGQSEIYPTITQDCKVVVHGGNPRSYTLTVLTDSNVERFGISRTQALSGAGSVNSSLHNGDTVYYGDILEGQVDCYPGYYYAGTNYDTTKSIGPIEVLGNTTIDLRPILKKLSAPTVEGIVADGTGEDYGATYRYLVTFRNPNPVSVRVHVASYSAPVGGVNHTIAWQGGADAIISAGGTGTLYVVSNKTTFDIKAQASATDWTASDYSTQEISGGEIPEEETTTAG